MTVEQLLRVGDDIRSDPQRRPAACRPCCLPGTVTLPAWGLGKLPWDCGIVSKKFCKERVEVHQAPWRRQRVEREHRKQNVGSDVPRRSGRANGVLKLRIPRLKQ